MATMKSKEKQKEKENSKKVKKVGQKTPKRKDVSVKDSSAQYDDMDVLADDIIDENELNLNEVKKMNYTELFELIHYFEVEDDFDTVNILKPYLDKLKSIPIQLASLEDRIWSYFYEKYILRIVLVLWGIIGYNLKDKFLSWFSLDENIQMNGESVPAIALIIGVVAVIIILAWRIYTAFMESNLNVKKRHALRFRRSMRILVVNKDATIPGIFKSFFRGLFRAFPFSFITILTMQTTKSGRGMHDLLFNTIVLKLEPDVTDQEIKDFINFNQNLF